MPLKIHVPFDVFRPSFLSTFQFRDTINFLTSLVLEQSRTWIRWVIDW